MPTSKGTDNEDVVQALGDVEIDLRELVIGESVGDGMTAEVFKGTYAGDVVAIKQILKHRHMTVKEQVSFSREISILAEITHPNLVRLFGVSFRERPWRIVTEFCRGGTLFDLLHNSMHVELVWAQAWKLCIDVAKAMEYLHGHKPQKIIHRDLKSLNLLLADEVRSSKDTPLVKVADFGFSKMVDVSQAPGQMTAAVGTLHWMAPEILEGTNYDEKVDIYSYSMVLFEVICREVPFDEEEPAEIPRLVLDGVRPDMEAIPPDCPKVLKTLMMDCWSHDPKSRPSFKGMLPILTGAIVPPSRPIGASSRPGSAGNKMMAGYQSKSLARGPGNVVSM
mmetsp:Transcript_105177/g.224674  ORF Transcript_105177/g.224674 Transcript_105177/m.224674 type:complete len:336 (-) Transcript_105177:193-1200(-)